MRNEFTLIDAIKRNDLAEVERLLDRVANINAQNATRDGWSPLHEACNQGRTDIARLLLDRGADVGARNRHGDTAHDIVVFFAEHEAEYKKLLLLFNT